MVKSKRQIFLSLIQNSFNDEIMPKILHLQENSKQ